MYLNSKINSSSSQSSSDTKTLIVYIDELRSQFRTSLLETSSQQIKKEELVKSASETVERLSRKVEVLNEKWLKMQLNFREKITGKNQTIESLEKEMEQMKTECDEKINDVV